MKADTVIRNGKVVTPHGVVLGGVAIADEKILTVTSDGLLPEGRNTYDARGRYVIPGIIDPHVHLASDEPGQAADRYADDFRTETRGAAYGGVTCFLTRIASLDSYEPVFETVVEWGEANSLVDFFLNAAVFTREHVEQQKWLYDQGVAAFKHFFIAYRGEEGRQKSLQPVDAGLLFESFENIGRLGEPAIALVHAEQMDIIDVLRERLEAEGRTDLAAWTESRPWFTELMQIEAAALVAEATGAALYLPHVTIGRGVEAVERHRSRGTKIYAETCPHYLVFSKDSEELESWGKVVPPLREHDDQEELWDGIRRGVVTLMGTDLCPYSRASKEQRAGKGNLWGAMPGFNNGMEHLMPLMWTYGVEKGRIGIEQLVQICSENVARTFGLYPQKGALLPGSDADIVVVDSENEVEITEDFYHTRSPEWSAYFGHRVRGRSALTMVRGRVLLNEGVLDEAYGHGKYIPMGR